MSSIISFMVGFAGIIIVALFLSGCAQGNILPITTAPTSVSPGGRPTSRSAGHEDARPS